MTRYFYGLLFFPGTLRRVFAEAWTPVSGPGLVQKSEPLVPFDLNCHTHLITSLPVSTLENVSDVQNLMGAPRFIKIDKQS